MYRASDWKRHPLLATQLLLVILVGTVLCHLLINLCLEAKQSLHVYFLNEIAAVKIQENGKINEV